METVLTPMKYNFKFSQSWKIENFQSDHSNEFVLISDWDWPSIDPAIVSATAQHCDLYATQPPPGFTLTPTIDSKYMFNNYI